jgi:hypothetical protein
MAPVTVTPGQDLLGGPPPTLLPDDPEVRAALDRGDDPRDVAAAHPGSALAWAVLAVRARAGGDAVSAYAFARTGYHRSLDLLRRNGWKGHGPVPWEHPGNEGFLRSLHELAEAAAAIGEKPEAERCRAFLRDSSASAAMALQG